MSKTPNKNKFAPEVRVRAIRMVLDHQRDYPSRWATVVSIAGAAVRQRGSSVTLQLVRDCVTCSSRIDPEPLDGRGFD